MKKTVLFCGQPMPPLDVRTTYWKTAYSATTGRHRSWALRLLLRAWCDNLARVGTRRLRRIVTRRDILLLLQEGADMRAAKVGAA
jgi:hypothetical protein